MNRTITRMLSGVAALGIALSGLALGAGAASADEAAQPKTTPTTGTITITNQDEYTVTHSFQGWNLAKLVNVSATLSSGSQYQLQSFQMDTTDKYVAPIEQAMKATKVAEARSASTTLYEQYQKDPNYFVGENDTAGNNPMGWLASYFSGDARENGVQNGGVDWQSSKSDLRTFVTNLDSVLRADSATYPADDSTFKSDGQPKQVAQGMWLLDDITSYEGLASGTTAKSAQENASVPILLSTTYEGVSFRTADGTVKDVTVSHGNRGAIGEITVKNTLPSIAKEVVVGNKDDGYTSQDHPDYAIGDEVSYRIYSRVPVYTGYGYNPNYNATYASWDNIPTNEKTVTRHLDIVDTASKQLTVDQTKAVESVQLVNPTTGKVDATLKEGVDYDIHFKSVSAEGTAYDGGTETKIDLGKYVNLTPDSTSTKGGAGVLEGDTIVVIFKATLNKYAAISEPDKALGNPNKTTLVYSNRPSDGSSIGYLPGDEVNVYTFKFQLKKTDEAYKSTGGASGQALKGAKFVVQASATSEHAGKYLATTKDEDGRYDVKWLDEKPTKAKTSTSEGVFTSDENGLVEGLVGLDAGTYTVSEIQAPEGYLGFSLPTFKISVWTQYHYDNGTTGNGYQQHTWTCSEYCKADADGTTAWGDWTIGDKNDNAGVTPEENGTVSIAKGDNSDYVYTDATAGTPKYQLNVYNAKYLTQLPLTGGAGLIMLVAVAVLLFGASGILVVRSRKASAARRDVA